MGTKIEWVAPPGYKPEILQLVAGCTPISEGCLYCWAARMASRNLPNMKFFHGLAKDGKWTGEIRLNRNAQKKSIKFKSPRCFFVCPMSDLFHEDVEPYVISSVLDAALLSEQHIFQFLTKRAQRMYESVMQFGQQFQQIPENAWFGVSIENMLRWRNRVPILRKMPACIRFISVEPLLGFLDLQPAHLEEIDWVIIGCESLAGWAGRFCKNEPLFYEAVRQIVDVCKVTKTAVFVKQLPIGGKVSRDPGQWPEELRIREFPI